MDGTIEEQEQPSKSMSASNSVSPLSPIQSFEDTDDTERTHQGLLKLDQAVSLLEDSEREDSDDDVEDHARRLITESTQDYLTLMNSLMKGQSDKEAITQGAPQVAKAFMLSKKSLPEALELMRWFCSVHMASLVAVVDEVYKEAEQWTIVEAREGRETQEDVALKMLRVLIAAFNSFLRNCRSKLFSNESHVRQLEEACSTSRQVLKQLAHSLSHSLSYHHVGKATIRLRAVIASACFARLSCPPAEHKQAMFTTLWTAGHRDVDILLESISVGAPADAGSFLRRTSNCLEAVSALRSTAMLAPHVYPKIAIAFADAMNAMDSSRGDWGKRPTLSSASVRHALIASATCLADRVGRAPDPTRKKAYASLCAALDNCRIMQTGQYVLDREPRQGTAAARALDESRHASERIGNLEQEAVQYQTRDQDASTEDNSTTATVIAGSDSGARQTTSDHSNGQDPILQSSSREGRVAVLGKRPRASERSLQSLDVETPCPPVPSMTNKGEGWTAPRPIAVSQIGQSSSSTPSSSPTSLAPVVQPANKPGLPPLKTAPEEGQNWKDGTSYKVILGDSFSRSHAGATKHSGRKGKGSFPRDAEGDTCTVHFAHWKYDFIPGRTDLDAPASLRQGPLRGADGRTADEGRRWSAEMEYKSRDQGNPRAVQFSGGASWAQDVECALIFNGETFVMEKIDVNGAVKYVQDVTAPVRVVVDAAEALAAKKKQTKLRKSKEEREREREKDRTEKRIAKEQEKREKREQRERERKEKKEQKAAEKKRKRGDVGARVSPDQDGQNDSANVSGGDVDATRTVDGRTNTQ